MQPSEVTSEVPYDVLLNLHKSPAEAVKNIRRQAAIRYYKKTSAVIGKSSGPGGDEQV